jgi:hypothetical protein
MPATARHLLCLIGIERDTMSRINTKITDNLSTKLHE